MVRSPRHWMVLLLSMLGVALAAVLAAWWLAQPARPDAFYEPPAEVPARPGQLLRQATFERQVPVGAMAWRILYTTTDAQGAPALASAIVLRPAAAATQPRPVIAWTHGTTGVARGCAPSLLDEPFANLPALAGLIERGWVLVATDYAGQGTAGAHPYLIGEGEARSALDAVRAARQTKQFEAGDRTVVWGHSQGGHAALWAGIVAPSYAPDVPLAGVAVAAPATELRALIETVQHTVVGRIMSAYLLQAYSTTYADVRFGDYARGTWAAWLAQDMASRCLAGSQALFSVAQSLLLGRSLFSESPTQGALGQRLEHNTPRQRLPQPLLVAQGLADDLVLPTMQSHWVAQRCAEGQTVEHVRYPGLDHLSLVAPDSAFGRDLIDWTAARLAGTPAAAACSERVAAGGNTRS